MKDGLTRFPGGAMSLLSTGLTVALVTCFVIGPAKAQHLEQIEVEGIQPHSLFGGSMGLDGSDLIVGSRWDNQRANNAGAAFVFSRPDGDPWDLVAKLTANDGRNSDYFGSGVDVSGDWAVVGASGFNKRQGAAYLFQRSGDNWVQRTKLIPSGNSERSVFGGVVAIDGQYVAVGASDHFRSGETRTGAVYVYYRNSSGAWGEQKFIMPSDAGSSDYVGQTVALSGNFLAIGAPGDEQLRGAVYIFRRDGTNWVQQQKLSPGDGRVGDGFGLGLAMDNTTLVVGAPHVDESVNNGGSVYVYRRNGNNFSLDSKLTATDPRVSQMFGFSVNVSGSDLLVGAPGDRRGSGGAYMFERNGSGQWRQLAKLVAPVDNRRAAFGRTVVIGVQDYLIGSTGDTGVHFQSGAVYSLGGGGGLRQGFQSVAAGFVPLSNPNLSFADADNDGDLDLVVYGKTDKDNISLYLNQGADAFKSMSTEFDAPSNGSVSWTDIDNNGSMDLLIGGDFGGELRTDVYLNDGGSMTKSDFGIPGLEHPNYSWSDYDRDGDRDLLLTGTDSAGPAILLLRHTANNAFAPVEVSLPAFGEASADWGDYDNDGDPDILLTGLEDGVATTAVLRNDGTQFTRIAFEIPGVVGLAQWVDFTSDGRLDMFLCGSTGDDVRTIVAENDLKIAFNVLDVSLPGLESCSASWGDYDNDGDEDLALSGTEFGKRITDIFENLGEEGFNESGFKLSRVTSGDLSWVDFDRDGRLDLAVAGETEDGPVVDLYRNNIGLASNDVPGPPGMLRAVFDGTSVSFSWTASTDGETAGSALTYNLRVGSAPGGIDVITPHTNRNGLRTLTTAGNVGHVKGFTLEGLAAGTYYWSVQAVDNAFAGSEFAAERSFVVGQGSDDFHDINALISGVSGGTTDFVDFRGGGYLDILVTGRNNRGPFTALYKLDPTTDGFTPTGINFPGVDASAAAFGDYDNDADMDLALIGETDNGLIARIYRNDGRDKITDISAPLVPVSNGSIAWGDLDNDGDVELVLTGYDGNTRVALVYTNNHRDEFEVSPVSFVRLSHGSIDIGDFDGDSDNDVLLTGFDGETPRSILYRNDGFPNFSRVEASFVGIRHGEGAFGDFDGDGDLDILISGQSFDGPMTQVYENRGSENFVAMETTLPDLEHVSIALGDYDNNGKMDVLLSGSNGSRNVAAIYRYMGSKDGFQILHIADIPATQKGGVAAGDYDRDGRLDILVSGEGSYFPTSRVIQNQMARWKNSSPSKPTGLSYRIEGNKLHLFWLASQDAETPSSSLSYDLRVSTKHSGSDIMAPNTKPNGDRISVARGNVGHNRRWTIVDPPPGRITVSVHAVDGGYLASESSDMLTLEIGDHQSSFAAAKTAFLGVEYGQATWVDLDEDGDIDINVIGGSIQQQFSRQYLNYGHGEFSEVGLAIPAVAHATTVWGDYDGDGDDDLYISGQTESGLVAYVLRNDSGLVFIDIQAPLDLVDFAEASWADFDGDGDADLIVSGSGSQGLESTIYRNQGGDSFSKTAIVLPGVFKASHDWADFDGDGDLDLLLTGSDGTFLLTRVLKNRGNDTFRDAEIHFVNVFDGTGDWIDFDGDGDLDVVITGNAFAGVVAKVFVNTGTGSFVESTSPFPGVRVSSTSWGDFDNDGDLDVAIAGWDGVERITNVYENSGDGTFMEIFTTMIGISVGSVGWADADGDGDLDLLVAGSSAEAPVTNVYLYDSSLGSDEDSRKRTTSAEAAPGTNELPLAVDGFLFKQSYPNPFATQTTVHFAVGRPQHARITLYNTIGQVVKTPYEGIVRANEMMTVLLDAAGIATGAYFLRIQGESFAQTRTIIVNK